MNTNLCMCGNKSVRRGLCWKHYRQKLKQERWLADIIASCPNGQIIIDLANKIESLPWIGLTQKTPEQAGFFHGINEQITTGDRV